MNSPQLSLFILQPSTVAPSAMAMTMTEEMIKGAPGKKKKKLQETVRLTCCGNKLKEKKIHRIFRNLKLIVIYTCWEGAYVLYQTQQPYISSCWSLARSIMLAFYLTGTWSSQNTTSGGLCYIRTFTVVPLDFIHNLAKL